ncbi:MAG: hypothetical protein WAK33_01940, partial [Silvibacterium sp.]
MTSHLNKFAVCRVCLSEPPGWFTGLERQLALSGDIKKLELKSQPSTKTGQTESTDANPYDAS